MTGGDARSSELARWGRDSVKEALGGPKAEPPQGAWTRLPAATFVTWRWSDSGRLQGCVGTLEARRTVVADVACHAVAAALEDPRTAPLSRPEQVDLLDMEISELSPLEPIELGCGDEASAAAALRPGRDGVVLAWRGRRGTLLPAVWARIPDGAAFLRALKEKAGMPRNAWDRDVRLWRYAAVEHHDRAPARRAS